MSRLAIAIGLAAGVTLLPLTAAPANAEVVGGYGSWTVSAGTPISGAVALPAAGFPDATFETDAYDVTVPTGASTWISPATPPGAVYGGSQDQSYLNVRPAANNPDSPSTTTITFDSPTPASGWAMIFGDIDADTLQISATGADGSPVASADLGFQGVFNYCDATPRPSSACAGATAPFDLPTWDEATGTLDGNFVDTQGASGWFEPTIPLSSVTLTFTMQSGQPIYQTWFASLQRDISGTVTMQDGSPYEGATLELLAPDGSVVATTESDATGGYLFSGYSTEEYTVRVSVDDPALAVDGPDELPVAGEAADDIDNDFVLVAATYPVSGQVTLPGGDGVPDASITVFDADGAVVAELETDENGQYTTDALPVGDYRIVLTTPDGAVAEITELNRSIEDGPITDADFALAGLTTIEVETAVTDGDIPTGVAVVVTGPDGFVEQISTDENGTGVVPDLAPGDYEVSYTVPEGYTGDETPVAIAIDGETIGGTVNVVIELAPVDDPTPPGPGEPGPGTPGSGGSDDPAGSLPSTGADAEAAWLLGASATALLALGGLFVAMRRVARLKR